MEKIEKNTLTELLPNSNKTEDNISLHLKHLLEAAFKRSFDAVSFFEKKAASSRDVLSKAFFLYLSVKKDAQRVILKKIAISLGFTLHLHYEESITHEDFKISQEEIEDIYQTVSEVTGKELDFYLTYASVENRPRIKSFILILADLAKEFLFDSKIWFLNHKGHETVGTFNDPEAVSHQYIMETVLN